MPSNRNFLVVQWDADDAAFRGRRGAVAVAGDSTTPRTYRVAGGGRGGGGWINARSAGPPIATEITPPTPAEQRKLGWGSVFPTMSGTSTTAVTSATAASMGSKSGVQAIRSAEEDQQVSDRVCLRHGKVSQYASICVRMQHGDKNNKHNV